MAFKDKQPLEAKTVAASGNLVFELSQLSDDARLLGIMFELSGLGTAAASTQAVTPTILSQLITLLTVDSEWWDVKCTGRIMHILHRHMNGMGLGGAQSVTCTTGGDALRAHYWLPCVDANAYEPNDCAVPCDQLNENKLEVNLASSLVLDLTNDVTISGATLRAIAHLAPKNTDRDTLIVPTKSRIRYEAWGATQANLKPGVRTYAGIYDETELAVTIAEYAQLTVQSDGATIIDRQLTQNLIAEYNHRRVLSSDDQLNPQPSQNLEFLPYITAPRGYKATNCLRAERGFQVDIDSGTATTQRHYYRDIVPATPAQVEDLAVRQGFNPEAMRIDVKTASKSEVQGSARRQKRVNRLLPKRIYR